MLRATNVSNRDVVTVIGRKIFTDISVLLHADGGGGDDVAVCVRNTRTC